MKIVIISTCAALLGAILLYSKSKASPVASFVIPDGYVGIIAVALDRSVANSASDPMVVSKDGLVQVYDMEIFKEWHKINASYADGTAIRYMNDGKTGGIAFWSFSSDGFSDKEFFFIGTESEWDRIQNKLYAGDNSDLRLIFRDQP